MENKAPGRWGMVLGSFPRAFRVGHLLAALLSRVPASRGSQGRLQNPPLPGLSADHGKSKIQRWLHGEQEGRVPKQHHVMGNSISTAKEYSAHSRGALKGCVLHGTVGVLAQTVA